MQSEKIQSERYLDVRRKAALYTMFSAALREPVPVLPNRQDFESLWRDVKMDSDAFPLLKDPENVEESFRSIFGHNLSPDCPPYETHYGKVGVFRKSHTMADLAGLYRAFGVETAAGDRRVDHLPVQIEFAGLLLYKEALALERGDEEKAEVCSKARAKLIHEHLAIWVPAFSEAVSKKNAGNYFEAIVRRLAAFIAWDASLLGVPKPTEETLSPAAVESPCVTCFGGIDEQDS